ncbi:MAG TPA: ATP-binding cassette domain-containing protein, partial [Candidatus Hydrogenedentes bacterium]|nr:ATP-binding cassette domain-containing protein [Candidatus Hydrogenedentota bacterium]
MNEPAVEARNLTKVYKALGKRPVHSLRGLNLSIARGQVFGFLGRNGAGKTTLTKTLAGETLPTSGKIDRGGEIGYLPQDPRSGNPEDLARTR